MKVATFLVILWVVGVLSILAVDLHTSEDRTTKLPEPDYVIAADRIPTDYSFTRTESLGVFSDGGTEKGAIIYRNGRVELVNNTTPTEGARAFWNAVSLAYPDFCSRTAASQAPKNASNSGHLQPLDKSRAKLHDRHSSPRVRPRHGRVKYRKG